MTPETADTARVALLLQRGLLAGYACLLSAAVIVGARRRNARPWAFAVGVLAAAYVVYYALFLREPRVLLAAQTVLFSISLRYMEMFLATFLLAIAAWGRRWKR